MFLLECCRCQVVLLDCNCKGSNSLLVPRNLNYGFTRGIPTTLYQFVVESLLLLNRINLGDLMLCFSFNSKGEFEVLVSVSRFVEILYLFLLILIILCVYVLFCSEQKAQDMSTQSWLLGFYQIRVIGDMAIVVTFLHTLQFCSKHASTDF